MRFMVEQADYSTDDVVTYVEKVDVKAGEYVHVDRSSDLMIAFSGEDGATPGMYYDDDTKGTRTLLNTADVSYLTPVPLVYISGVHFYVSCDVDTTVTIVRAVMPHGNLRDSLLRCHTVELSDGRSYEVDMESRLRLVE